MLKKVKSTKEIKSKNQVSMQNLIKERTKNLLLADEYKYYRVEDATDNMNRFGASAKKLNTITYSVLRAKNAKDLKSSLEKLVLYKNILNKLRRSSDIDLDDFTELMNLVDITGSIAGKHFKLLGGLIHKNGTEFEIPDDKKDSKKSRTKTNKWMAISGLGFLIDSPALERLGERLKQRTIDKIEAKRNKIAEEKEKLESEKETEIDELMEQMSIFDNSILKTKGGTSGNKFAPPKKSDTKVQTKIPLRDKTEQFVKKNKEAYQQKKDERAKTVRDIKESEEDMDEYISDQVGELQKEFSHLSNDEAVDLQNLLGNSNIDSNEIANEWKSIAESGKNFDYNRNSERLPYSKPTEFYNRESDFEDDEDEDDEYVEGNIGDVYDLLGDIKDILSDYLMNWKNINTEQQTENRDRWLEGIDENLGLIGKDTPDGIKKANLTNDKNITGSSFMGTFLGGGAAGIAKKIATSPFMATFVRFLPWAAAGLLLGKGIKEIGKRADNHQKGQIRTIHKAAEITGSRRKEITDFLKAHPEQQKDISKMLKENEEKFLKQDQEKAKSGSYKERKDARRSLKREYYKDYAIGQTYTTLTKQNKDFQNWKSQKQTPSGTKNQHLNLLKTTKPSKETSAKYEVEGVSDSVLIEDPSQYLEIRDNAKFQGLQPNMQQAVLDLGKKYYSLTGKRLPLNSAYRTYADQQQIYSTHPGAAKPGTSRHETGLAIDTDTQVAEFLDKSGILDKYGLYRPYPEPLKTSSGKTVSERHHIEIKRMDPKLLANKNQPEKPANVKAIGEPMPNLFPENYENKNKITNQKRQNQISNFQQNNNTNIVQPPDYAYFIDDPRLRFHANNGIV